MITEEGSKGKGKLVKSAHGLARAVEDAISAKDAVVATVVSVGDKWRLNGRIQCRIGTMGLVEVTCRGVEDVQIDDSILVRKVGRGPTSRWIFVGWHWGMREGAGGLGTMIPTVRLDSIPAHAATHQDAGADEINVGGLSGDLADPQDPKAHSSSHQDGGSDEINVAGLSGDLADAQDAKSHASSHQDGGGDEISVQGLSGDLADAQDPKTHASTHENGGGDEISVAGLSGVLADQQDANKIKGVDVIDTAIGDGKVLVYRTASGDLGYEAQAAGGGGLQIFRADKDADGDYDAYISASWNGDSFSTGFGTINWNTAFGVPADAKAVFLWIMCRDSDVNAPADGGSIQFKAKQTTSDFSLGVSSKANDIWDDVAGWVSVAADGTSYYGITASGAGTCEIYIKVTMYAT